MAVTTWDKVVGEVNQDHRLRLPLIRNISKYFENRYVVSLYVARIDDSDPEMLKSLLGGSKAIVEKKVLFIISSPGGDPLAAERIMKVLSEYSDNDYWALVPGTAKSAATMICMGASKIILSPVSELGPIDLQIEQDGALIPAHSFIKAYDHLMELGISLSENERVEPVLQQLQQFKASEIELFRAVNELSPDMAVKALKGCMLKKLSKKQIKNLIKIFLDPKKSKVHGRPLYYSDIKLFDKDNHFNLELINTDTKIWQDINEYHTRIEAHIRAMKCTKLVESAESIYRGWDNEKKERKA